MNFYDDTNFKNCRNIRRLIQAIAETYLTSMDHVRMRVQGRLCRQWSRDTYVIAPAGPVFRGAIIRYIIEI